MAITKRTKLTTFSTVTITLIVILGVWDVHNLIKIENANYRIKNDKVERSDFVEENFYLAQSFIAKGDSQTALIIFNQIAQKSLSNELKAKALFNSGNLYFRAAVAAEENSTVELIVPNLELAKATYRKALEHWSRHDGARYNLERVLQLSPEGSFKESTEGMKPERGERAVTTMKLQALGMP